MKKTYFYTLVFLLAQLNFSTATAQSKLEYQISSGFSNPISPDNFDTNWKTGYNIGLGIDYALDDHFQLSSSLQFDRFGLDLKNRDVVIFEQSGIVAPPLVDYGDANAITLMLNIKYSPFKGQVVVPYVTGGLGLFRMWMEKRSKNHLTS